MDLSLLPDGGMRWLDASGPKSTIVLSTRIRLARNVHGIPFSQRAKDSDRTAVLDRVSEGAGSPAWFSAAGTFWLRPKGWPGWPRFLVRPLLRAGIGWGPRA